MNPLARRALIVTVCLVFASPLSAAWLENGFVPDPLPGEQSSAAVCSDGAGGMIVVFGDTRSGTSHIYSQRVNALGQPLWAAGGVVVCDYSAGEQVNPCIAEDGAGGAYIAWEDFVPSTSMQGIYAQHLTSAGVRTWNAAGLAIASGHRRDFSSPVIA